MMYMHTLDGQPASFAMTRERRGDVVAEVPFICFASRRSPVTLVPTLRQLRREQRLAIADAKGQRSPWGMERRYSYVRVDV